MSRSNAAVPGRSRIGRPDPAGTPLANAAASGGAMRWVWVGVLAGCDEVSPCDAAAGVDEPLLTIGVGERVRAPGRGGRCPSARVRIPGRPARVPRRAHDGLRARPPHVPFHGRGHPHVPRDVDRLRRYDVRRAMDRRARDGRRSDRSRARARRGVRAVLLGDGRRRIRLRTAVRSRHRGRGRRCVRELAHIRSGGLPSTLEVAPAAAGGRKRCGGERRPHPNDVRVNDEFLSRTSPAQAIAWRKRAFARGRPACPASNTSFTSTSFGHARRSDRHRFVAPHVR